MFESIPAQGEAALLEVLSVGTYPDGGVVSPDGLFVDAVCDSNGVLQSARMVMWASSSSTCIEYAHLPTKSGAMSLHSFSCMCGILGECVMAPCSRSINYLPL